MPDSKKTLIMKFGGASVAQAENFASIAKIIIRRSKEYAQLVVVVSAMGDMTDQLNALAHKVDAQPPKREMDMLLSVGERISSALLAMALAREGVSAVSLTGSQSGIITSCDHAQAKIVDVTPWRIQEHLNKGQVVIVAGFQGVSEEKEITTLGRGGSDTTAVALGVALRAWKVEYYKDVEGIFECDPKQRPSKLYSELDFDLAAQKKVLHKRAVELAQNNGICLHIRSFETPETEGTIVGLGAQKKREMCYEV